MSVENLRYPEPEPEPEQEARIIQFPERAGMAWDEDVPQDPPVREQPEWVSGKKMAEWMAYLHNGRSKPKSDDF